MTYISVPEEQYNQARQNLVLHTQVGSVVYGTNLPGTEDRDEIAISCMPPADVLGMHPAETIVWRTAGASTKSGPDDIDLAIYSLKKFIDLASQGNPSILTVLWTNPEHLLYTTEVGLLLRAQRGLFVSKKAGYRFLGYMNAQRDRMIDSRAGVRAPRTNRPELIEKYGFDTKFAMHMLRLGLQGDELLRTGEMSLPMMEPDRTMMVEIRQGKHDYETVLAWSYEISNALERTIENSDLPKAPDRGEVDRLSVDLHFRHWG